MPCKGIVAVKSRGLSDVRRPDYETIAGFGANLAERRPRGRDRVSRRVQPLRHRRGELERRRSRGSARRSRRACSRRGDLDGIDMRWGNGEGALALTDQDGDAARAAARGCATACARAAAHVGTRQRALRRARARPGACLPRLALHVADGRHVHRRSDARPAHRGHRVVERDVQLGAFPIPNAVDEGRSIVAWKGTEGKGVAQAHFSQRASGDERPRPLHVHAT